MTTTTTPEGAGEFPPLPLPTCTYADHSYPAFTADQMHAFAEATVALRAQAAEGEPSAPEAVERQEEAVANVISCWKKFRWAKETSDAVSALVAAYAQAPLAATEVHGAVERQEGAPDLIARGMTWEETERHMREACAQAGVQWDDEKEPQSIAINVMQRLANAAHKTGFRLALDRASRAHAAPAPEAVDRVGLYDLDLHVGDKRALRAAPASEAAPRDAIAQMLAECMDTAVANGANSVSMPDHLVEVAAWLSGIAPASEAVAWLVEPNGLSSPRMKRELTFDRPHERPDWTVTPLGRIVVTSSESGDAVAPTEAQILQAMPAHHRRRTSLENVADVRAALAALQGVKPQEGGAA